jgi:8-oxo-dGTP pyrophosphatase MutT (NUDIX family)
MTDRFVVVPAAYVFLLRDAPAGEGRQVLLQLRRGTGYMDEHWAAAVAGHVERGESVQAAAQREALEEVGVTDVDVVPWGARQRPRRGGAGDQTVGNILTTTSWTGTPRIVEPEKCADLQWFDLDALPDPVVPHELRVLTSIREGSTPPIVTHGF